MKLQEATKLQGIVNDLRIQGISEEKISVIVDKLFPVIPTAEKTAKGNKAKGLGRRGGNNVEFQIFMEDACKAPLKDIFTYFEPSKGNSDKAQIAVDAMVTWLKGRSSLGTDTVYQNKYFAEYIVNVLSGKNKYEEKANMYKVLSIYGPSYQNFKRDGNIRPAWTRQAGDFITFLRVLNLL